jgi:signal transduction histidine kinase
VVVNLVSNAVKYAPGQPIEVQLKVQNKKAILMVRDQGLGIPKDKQELIFDRFERGAANHSTSGLGLGLYIVRTILKEHQGNIRVESENGRGSTFIVELGSELEAEFA